MTDLIILGNGMAGMTAALYAKRANLDFKIVGKDEYDFGQIGNAVLVENYPCASSQTGFDLAMSLHNQLEANDIKVEEHEVISVEKATGLLPLPFIVEYADGTVDEAKSIIYALGATPYKLKCEIETGVPIHYCAICDGPLYKDKTVAIIGGGDVAFTQAEYLSKICKQVIIVMCDENITAAPATAERVKKIDNIYIEYNFPVIVIKKINNHIALFSEEPGSTLSSWYGPRVDGVFVAIGMKPNIAPLDIFLDCWDEKGHIITDNECGTKYPGLFAAGDIR
jgi:thioredoxin reductase (NADPH)